MREWLGRNGTNGNGRGFSSSVGLNQVGAFWNGGCTNSPGVNSGGGEKGDLDESAGISGALTDAHQAAGRQNHWSYLLPEGSKPTNGGPASSTCINRTVPGIKKAGQIFIGALHRRVRRRSHARARIGTVKAAWAVLSVPAQSGEPACSSHP